MATKYPKKYLIKVNIFNKNKNEICQYNTHIYYTNDIDELRDYLNANCKNKKLMFEFADNYFRDLNSLKLEDENFNFYGIDYTKNKISFFNQENWSEIVNNNLLKELLKKDLHFNF